MDAFLFATGIFLGMGLTIAISSLVYTFLTYYTFNDIS
jgi:hypothetical protein